MDESPDYSESTARSEDPKDNQSSSTQAFVIQICPFLNNQKLCDGDLRLGYDVLTTSVIAFFQLAAYLDIIRLKSKWHTRLYASLSAKFGNVDVALWTIQGLIYKVKCLT